MLDRFALVTYAVEPARLARHLPDGIVPDERGGSALISAVPFFDRDFAFRSLPFAKVSCGQINYRAYVRRGEERGVWFFGTSLDSVFVLLPCILWRMPWHRDRMRIEAVWSSTGPDAAGRPHCASYRLNATGSWGSASLRGRGTGRPMPEPPCFADPADCRATLLDPFTGWYGRRNGRGVGRYTVWHEPLRLEEVVVDDAWFQVFHDLDLVEDDQSPLAAGVLRTIAFDVHTPPTQVS